MAKIFKFDNAAISPARVMSVAICVKPDAAATWTNMPVADTFLFGSVRHVQLVSLYGMTQARLKVNKQATAGQTGATLRLTYAKAYSTSVGAYSAIGTTACSVAVDVQNAHLDSGWVDLDPGVFDGGDDIYLAVIGSGGNAVLDPTFGSISADFR